MKNHVWRPLYIAIVLVLLAVAARFVIVPSDFGVHERGYMYGWHRKSNEAEWKAVTVKYQTAKACIPCHKEKSDDIKDSPHGKISCENCHGPKLDHPNDPKRLEINRARSLCLRCHTKLPYNGTLRGSMKGVNPETHYPQAECMMCHYPHDPRRQNQWKGAKR
jgi:hypothetical protein